MIALRPTWPLPGRLDPCLPCGTGVGLKAQHYHDALAARQLPAFVEVHAENYLHPGGPAHRYLAAIRERCELSIHGVGLSLGGPEAPAREALAARRELLQRYQPRQFSEHLAWTQLDGSYLNDLLPIAYTEAALKRTAAHVDAAQEALGCRILIENPATYVQYAHGDYSEPDFIHELVKRSGCGLLLDVNNIVVSARNHGFDPGEYLEALPLHAVGEIHLAAHSEQQDRQGLPLLIDSHNGPVQPPTWELYQALLARVGPLPSLIEWDSNLPDWSTLLAEAACAEQYLHAGTRRHAAN